MKTFLEFLILTEGRKKHWTWFPMDALATGGGYKSTDTEYTDKITKSLKNKKKLPKNPVKNYLSSGPKNPDEPVNIRRMVIPFGKKTHLLDNGHHRYWGRKRAGKKMIKVWKRDI